MIMQYNGKVMILDEFFSALCFRLGSKLPPGISQPPQFAKRPWETQPQSRVMQEPPVRSQHQHQPIVGRPLNHTPHIRNPKLRQYYLKGRVLTSPGVTNCQTDNIWLLNKLQLEFAFYSFHTGNVGNFFA